MWGSGHLFLHDVHGLLNYPTFSGTFLALICDDLVYINELWYGRRSSTSHFGPSWYVLPCYSLLSIEPCANGYLKRLRRNTRQSEASSAAKKPTWRRSPSCHHLHVRPLFPPAVIQTSQLIRPPIAGSGEGETHDTNSHQSERANAT
jgi:hypothetical protein